MPFDLPHAGDPEKIREITVFERIIHSNIHVDSTILIYVVRTWISRTVFVGRYIAGTCNTCAYACNRRDNSG